MFELLNEISTNVNEAHLTALLIMEYFIHPADEREEALSMLAVKLYSLTDTIQTDVETAVKTCCTH